MSAAALDAVRHRGSHLQIIASVGSGKTEVVAQRVADLLATDVAAEAIVAFTFTERAAEELKNRIATRVEDRLGRAALDRLNGLFVGTIHAFCSSVAARRAARNGVYRVGFRACSLALIAVATAPLTLISGSLRRPRCLSPCRSPTQSAFFLLSAEASTSRTRPRSAGVTLTHSISKASCTGSIATLPDGAGRPMGAAGCRRFDLTSSQPARGSADDTDAEVRTPRVCCGFTAWLALATERVDLPVGGAVGFDDMAFVWGR